MKRRKFISQISAGMAATMLPSTLLSFTPGISSDKKTEKLSFGIVSDVHKDLMPDADQRLETFIDEAQKRKVDFIIQMGDFCFGETKNKAFLKIWETFEGTKYHILGNHDMDRQSKQEIMNFWGMPKAYYSYDLGGYHFIVLDANFLFQDGKFIDYERANFYVDSKFRTYIDNEQIEWFKADLEATRLPTIVFSHQSLWHSVNNRLILQRIIEKQKEKVISCISGHSHIDFHHQKNDINYIGINSMSYQWSQNYTTTERFPKELYKQYGNLHHIAGYKDPLYAFATLKPKGTMKIEGVKSEWMPPSPYDLGMPRKKEGEINSPQISNYQVNY
ncbi:metallophosphoesterase family protein [Flavivirga spongiicola]|uniref:Metallophosphoesterase n=1 Tax=Flavivirga spongiicola TaxID=421621 RepID=A0ABU7XYN8_9FLAO|nr:metallophosphoesterase [Flavivirga sp. MEBiC05379]MDO5980056.1 metallophosphoesterase [Flavivirga sp. MEBiC05379]